MGNAESIEGLNPQERDENGLETVLEKYREARSRWERLNNERGSFRSKAKRFFTEGIMRGIDYSVSQAAFESDMAEVEVKRVLKKTAGRYPLKDIGYESRPLSNGDSYFKFSFAWQSKREETFIVEYFGYDLRVQAAENTDPKVEVKPGEDPILHLPKGFSVPLVAEFRENPYVPPTDYYAAWEPEMPNEATMIKIPSRFKIPFKIDPKDVTSFSETQVVSMSSHNRKLSFSREMEAAWKKIKENDF